MPKPTDESVFSTTTRVLWGGSDFTGDHQKVEKRRSTIGRSSVKVSYNRLSTALEPECYERLLSLATPIRCIFYCSSAPCSNIGTLGLESTIEVQNCPKL